MRLLILTASVAAVLTISPAVASAAKGSARNAGMSADVRKIDFGTVAVGSHQMSPWVTLTNETNDVVALQNVVDVENDGSFDYTLPIECYEGLQPGASCQIAVWFNPVQAGRERLATWLQFSDGEAIRLTGRAEASAPGVSADITSVDFGGVPVGEHVLSPWITLTNESADTISLTDVSDEVNDGSFDYTLPIECYDGLAPGASCQIGVWFSPVVAGPEQLVTWLRFSDGSAIRLTASGWGE